MEFVRKNIVTIIASVAILIGICLLMYPYVSDFLAKQSQLRVADTQEQVVGDMQGPVVNKEMERAIRYNKDLIGSRTVVTDPFSPDALKPTTKQYEEALNVNGDGVMAVLYIPATGVHVPIYHGTAEETLQKGVGHVEQTSLPCGGKATHCVLAGHTGLPSVRVFDDLDKLQKGDFFVIRVLGEDHAYRVYGTEVVLPEETESLVVDLKRDLVTLVTCTPYGVNTHRLLVHAERCKVPQEWLDMQRGDDVVLPADAVDNTKFYATVGGIAVALVVLSALFVWTRRRRKRDEREEPAE